MTNHNAPNERIKRQYFAYLAEALGHSEQSIDAAAKAIAVLNPSPATRTSKRSTSSKRGPSSAILQDSVATEAASR
jgi:hypothetical protein